LIGQAAMTFAKFGLVGVLNTTLGFAIILAALRCGLGDYSANVLGYSLGLILSYVVNRRWTFNVQEPVSPNEFLQFILAFCIAYSANLAVLVGFRMTGRMDDPVVHLAGLSVYSALFYLFSRYMVFGSNEHARPLVYRETIGQLFPFIGLFAAAGLALLVLWGSPLCHDVTWQLWIARQMLAGAVLYRDIWEINPPLWFWSAEPIVLLARTTHLNEMNLLILAIWSMAILSASIFGHFCSTGPIRRTVLMVFSLWVMLIVPLYDFGQREQLALILTLPYVALIARRSGDCKVSAVLALIVGIMAAYGFALKHYFVLVPVALELWLLWRTRTSWRPIRPETSTLAVAALGYLVCIYTFAPAYLTDMVPMIKASYQGYEGTWEALLLRPWTIFWFMGCGFFVVYRRGNDSVSGSMVTTLLIAAAVYLCAYMVQFKGWMYHSIPTTGFLALAIMMRLTATDMRRMLPITAGLMVMAYVFVIPVKVGKYSNFFQPEIDAVLATVPAGNPALVIAADPMWSWPTFRDHDLVWPSRLYSYWMIPAIGHAEIIGPYTPELRSVGIKIKEEAALEMRCAVPDLVMFERRRNYIYQPPSFNVRDYFLRDKEIREFLARYYREEEPVPSLYIYRRIRKPMKSTSPACRRPPLVAVG
jgi:putative flippase GtrA